LLEGKPGAQLDFTSGRHGHGDGAELWAAFLGAGALWSLTFFSESVHFRFTFFRRIAFAQRQSAIGAYH
jgi:hypothetical protein